MNEPVRSPDPPGAAERATLARIARGLKRLTVSFPHLSGLAAVVQVDLDPRVPTMGVFASGRLVANPDFTAKLNEADLQFVLAHELLHLALRTHERAVGSTTLEFNYAHDYIINDMLRHALGRLDVPAGGLDMHGARSRSAEEIVLEMRRNAAFTPARTQVWDGTSVMLEEALGAGRRSSSANAGDVLDAAKEREMFPESAEEQAARARVIRDLAARGMALAKALAAMRGRGNETGGEQRQVRALRGVYRTPWHIALQRWLEGVSPGERTYMRASRRGAERTDVVMPGRQRYSMILNVVLDTSASMTDDIPAALGAVADFCEAAGVDEVRVVQCDTVVTSDQTLSATELAQYEVKGYGGSDLTPALKALGEDARVTAVIVVTDGDVTYPTEAPPFSVLWALPRPSSQFTPPYGRIVTMDQGSAP